MKRVITLILVLLLLSFCGCAGNYAVNPLFGVCLMVNDSLYICQSVVADSELPAGLEYIGSIEEFGSSLPTQNFVSTSNDFGNELYQLPDEPDKVYSYNSEKEQHWLYARCDTGVALNGWMYIVESDHSEAVLPGGYTSVGTVTKCVESGVPTATLEAMGIESGTEIFTGSSNGQYIYAQLSDTSYLRLSRFIKISLN